MKVNQNLCLQCGACVENCPLLAISIDKKDGTVIIDEKKCVQCGACKDTCPRLAIQS